MNMPDDWRNRPCWRVLEIGFACGRRFLAEWQAWRDDAHRPRLLHHVAIEPDGASLEGLYPRKSAARDQCADRPPPYSTDATGAAPHARPVQSEDSAATLAQQLSRRCWGLTPGFHRLVFEDGQVLLTLCIGPVGAQLRAQRFDADAIWLNAGAARTWLASDAHAVKALTRCCRRGTWLGAPRQALSPNTSAALRAAGFVVMAPPEAVSPGFAGPLPVGSTAPATIATKEMRTPPVAPPPPATTETQTHSVAPTASATTAARETHANPVAPTAVAARAMPAETTTPADDTFCATFDPAWQPRRRPGADAASPRPEQATSALVIGAGVAGAAVAASLARRGLQVLVLDAHAEPAQGASGLPAGLFAPHLSQDDCLRSRWSRAGLRATIEFAQQRLVPGRDWQLSGVLERRADAQRVLADRLDAQHRDWSASATTARRAAAGWDAETTAVWHTQAGWIRPNALVGALLDDPRIAFRGNTQLHSLRPFADGWQALHVGGGIAAQAQLVVVAAGFASARLVGTAGATVDDGLPLQSVRGQLSFVASYKHGGAEKHRSPGAPELLAFPINGHGSLLPDVPLAHGQRASVFGATYQRDDASTAVRQADHRENLDRLRALTSVAGQPPIDPMPDGALQGWAGVRAVAPDRLPLIGPVRAQCGDNAPQSSPALWVCTGFASRGLSQAICGAELLAARLFAEPLPVEVGLANAVDVQRFLRAL